MRIVSKFSDYYDSIMGYGQDLTTVFIRKPEKVTDPSIIEVLNSRDQFNRIGYLVDRYPMPNRAKPPYRYLTVKAFRVYFCGKTYRGIVVTFLERKFDLKVGEVATKPSDRSFYFYNFDDLNQFLQTHGLLVKDICRVYFSREVEEIANLKFFLEKQDTDELTKELVKHRIVIAKYVGPSWNKDGRHWAAHWELNGSLAEIKFYKLIDPYTAYQELDMYLSGVLGRQAKEVVNISDKDRIHQRGFDEYSFRKLPEEKIRNSSQR